MKVLITDRNRGRDSTIDPYYLARKPQPSEGTPEYIQEEIDQLKYRVSELEHDYTILTQKLENYESHMAELEVDIEELTGRIVVLEQTIADYNERISELEEQLSDWIPISTDFINSLPPYNLQEGAG